MKHCHESRKHKDGSESPYHSYICNRYGFGGKTACSAHVLNQRVITNIVLLDIQLKATWAQNNPEALCVQLLHRYEDERLEKLEQKAELTSKIEAMEQVESDTDEWIGMIQDYSHLETLDRPTLLRLINRIEVGERKMVNGQDEREIKIYYNFVGFVEV